MPESKAATANRKLYIETVGCQMNLLDSELVVGKLKNEGYELTDDIALADTILYNTCSVRQHAEDKIYSALGRVRKLKEERPEITVGVLGCMAQKDQSAIFRRAPFVDIVVGPGQLGRVSELLTTAKVENTPQLAVSLARNAGTRDSITASFAEYDPLREPAMRPNAFQAYVRIMMGCDKFCTYCVVPSVRGPEQSRPPSVILDESRQLVDQGVKEITLIGQTVNSYKFEESPNRTARLSTLLYRLHEIEGLERIKFVTNYPNDMTDDLLQAVRDLPKVSRYLHVPAQSGCDAILKRMKRGYTIALYDDMMARIYEIRPDAAVSSDFIVGFCGETEESFEKSVALVERSRFKNSYIFKYSPRQGTKADTLLIDDVPEEVKKRRNNDLLATQNRICLEENRRLIGRVVDVLVEGRGKTGGATANGWDGETAQYSGRSSCDRVVVFEGRERLVGSMVPVLIEDASVVTLFGHIVTSEQVGNTLQGQTLGTHGGTT